MTKEAMRNFVRGMAVVCVLVGGTGSVLCVPYALAYNLNLVLAAGVYFVAGGVMIVGGLVALSVSFQEAV